MSIQSTRPSNKREFMDKLIIPYDQRYPNPNQIPSEPYKAGQPENDRSKEISLKNDTEKEFSIGIKDINEAILFYFENVLKLSVIQNNTRVKVPVIYGSSENWKSVQEDGYYRDANSKIMAPLLMIRRTNLSQNRSLGNKLDGNSVKNIQVFEKKFSKRNMYNSFNIQSNKPQQKEYVVAITPDYVTITYSCMIWTNFIEQMDKLVETINYASRSYWGDPAKFQFLSNIDSFDDQTTLTAGEDRLVRTSFSITLNGWLIPDVMNKNLSTINRVFSSSEVVFGLETATSTEEFVYKKEKSPEKRLSNIIASDSQSSGGSTTSTISQLVINYLNTNKEVTADSSLTTQNTATFNATWLSAPTGFPSTSIDNFTFFCNGQLIEKTAIISFIQSIGSCVLIIDQTKLSYAFDNTDEIIAIGKFA